MIRTENGTKRSPNTDFVIRRKQLSANIKKAADLDMPLNLQNVNLVMSAGFPEQFPCDGLPQIAFSGRSNVGKSSLINTLLGRKSLARVSGAPGKS